MAVKLRFKRMGNRNRPFYRLTAVDERLQRDGRVIEELGTYDPLRKDVNRQVSFDLDRCKYWLSVGAQPSETVAALLTKQGLKAKPGTKVEEQPTAPVAVAAEPKKQSAPPPEQPAADPAPAAQAAAETAEEPKKQSAPPTEAQAAESSEGGEEQSKSE